MAELMFPDIGGSFLRGQLIGTQQRQAREGEQRRNRLADLAGQAWSAPAEQRSAIVGQAVGVDPAAGMALAEGLSSEDDRRNQSMVHMAKLLTSAPEQYRPGLYQQMMPSLQRMGMSQLPPQYDDTVAQAAQSIVNAYAGVDGSTPAGLREFQGMTQGLEPDDVMRARRIALGLDGRASTSGFTQVKFTGSDGRERVGTLDGRTGRIYMADGTSFDPQAGQMEPRQPGPAAYAPPRYGEHPNVEAILQQANEMARVIPAEHVDAWVQQQLSQAPQGAQAAPMPAQAPQQAQQPPGGALPPRLDYQRGGSVDPFVGRTAEEQAAATEAARIRTQLDYAPQVAAAEADAARAKRQAEDAADRDSATASRAADAQDTLSLLEQAEPLLTTATGSLIGQGVDSALGAFGRSTQGADATAQLQTLAGQLVAKMPRFEGPQSDKDVQLYKQMAGDLANPSLPRSRRLAALQMIRTMNERRAEQAPGQQQPRQPQGNDIDSLLDIYR